MSMQRCTISVLTLKARKSKVKKKSTVTSETLRKEETGRQCLDATPQRVQAHHVTALVQKSEAGQTP